MIKILFYIDELRAGGAEKVLCNLVNNMDPSAFDITVHTTWKSDAESLLNSNIHYKYVYKNKSKLNRMLYRIEAQLRVFYMIHLAGNYDIEAAYLESGPTKVIASSTNKKAKHIAWIHCDLAKKFPDMQSFVRKTKKHYMKYDQVICVSEDCKQTYRKYFPDCAPSQVLYNVIDADEILCKSKMKEYAGIKRKMAAAAVGRMSIEKNYLQLLMVHKSLINEGFDYELWFVGNGPEKENLLKYVDANQLQDHVRFFGYMDNPYPIMKMADFLVCSSKYEGYSTVVIESMILGVPVITVNCGGMKEILGNSEFGMITENSEADLKRGIEVILTDDQLRFEYHEKALLRAAQLSGKNAAKQTENILIKLSEGNSSL